MLDRLLGKQAWSQFSQRAVSSKYQRPKPRHYKRRWFEAALKPILPKELYTCVPPGLLHEENIKKSKQYEDFELALATHVEKWLIKEDFRVLAVCQTMPVQNRTVWFTKNQWRLKDVEYKTYGSKIMRKVFERTPLSSTDVLFAENTACLFGRNFSTMKTIITETSKTNWLVPLAFFVDGKLLSSVEVRDFCALSDLEMLRAQTPAIFTGVMASLVNTLDQVSNQLPSTLSSIQNNIKS